MWGTVINGSWVGMVKQVLDGVSVFQIQSTSRNLEKVVTLLKDYYHRVLSSASTVFQVTGRTTV